jgi:hypothetical protein
VGQYAFLRVLPDTPLAVCLLTNGGDAGVAYRELCTELFRDLAGVEVTARPEPPATPVDLDLSHYEGIFKRLNVELEIRRDDEGVLTAAITSLGPLAERLPEADRTRTLALTPVDREVFLGAGSASPSPIPVVFFDFEGDAPKRIHFGARAMTRVGS